MAKTKVEKEKVPSISGAWVEEDSRPSVAGPAAGGFLRKSATKSLMTREIPEDAEVNPNQYLDILKAKHYDKGKGINNLYYNRMLLMFGAKDFSQRLSTKLATVGVVSALVAGAAITSVAPTEKWANADLQQAYGLCMILSVMFNLMSVIMATVYINHLTMLMVTPADIIW
eukprot:CAMPEP_0175151246 /NCGR_PEP_ID=MMETSP0087-20121206/18379_1 /TAXON_ID=136419 /ORGANISM="Unknown Unknown, Strain D1" /LENGTH=170 /DNA_ID=CAMNT_0016437401 /DNA_START=28 /DNA_END=537 /DNA_ORIENTATION=+